MFKSHSLQEHLSFVSDPNTDKSSPIPFHGNILHLPKKNKRYIFRHSGEWRERRGSNPHYYYPKSEVPFSPYYQNWTIKGNDLSKPSCPRQIINCQGVKSPLVRERGFSCPKQRNLRESKTLTSNSPINFARLQDSCNSGSSIKLFLRRVITLCGLVYLLLMTQSLTNLFSQETVSYTSSEIANAIKLAENSRNHPYGVMLPSCRAGREAFCRRACIRTIDHAKRDFGGEGDFIEFLSRRYAPIGCENDNGTNKYWSKNVKFFLMKQTKKGATNVQSR